MPKPPDRAKQAEFERIVRERKPKTPEEWQAIADEIPERDALDALGVPPDAFYRLSAERQAQMGRLVLSGLSWEEAFTRVAPSEGKA